MRIQDVPDLNSIVKRPSGNQILLRVQSQSIDFAHVCSDLTYVLSGQNIPEEKGFVAPTGGKAAIVLENSDIKDFSILYTLISLDEDPFFGVPQSHCAIGMA